MERAKILMREKLKSFKITMTSELEERLTHLSRIKEDKLKIARELSNEKELLKNKVKNFSTNNHRLATNIKPVGLDRIRTEIFKNSEDSRNSAISTRKYIIEEINSDIDNTINLSYDTERSSHFSNCKADPLSHITTKNSFILASNRNMYKDFVRTVLKIKFEKFPNNHPALKIPEKVLYDESLLLEVPADKFSQFIESELNSSEKYSKYTKITNSKKLSTLKRPMTIIHEEDPQL
jgi:hypothetical protein